MWQRLRKKLKHVHYKLKERIQQLRVLESSTFSAHCAPDSFFATSLRALHHAKPNTQGSVTDAPVPLHNEGEWRKRQRLDITNNLEARYRTLLDTAPARAPDQPTETPPPPQTAAAPSQTAPTPLCRRSIHPTMFQLRMRAGPLPPYPPLLAPPALPFCAHSACFHHHYR